MSLSEIAVSYSRLQWIQSIRPAGSTRPVLYSCPSHNIRRIIKMEGGGPHVHAHTHTHIRVRKTLKSTLRNDRHGDEYHISSLGCGCHSKCVLYLSCVHTLIEGWNPSQTKKKRCNILLFFLLFNILNKKGFFALLCITDLHTHTQKQI